MAQYRNRIDHHPSFVTTFTPWRHDRWSAYVDLVNITDLGIVRILDVSFPLTRPTYDLKASDGRPFGTVIMEQREAPASKADALEQRSNMEECAR